MKVRKAQYNKKTTLLAAVVLLLFAVWIIWRGGIPCLLKSITGLPCPSCGITRALFSIAQGKWADSFFWHPLWPFFILGAILYALQKRRQKEWIRSKTLKVFIICLVVGIYLFRLVQRFPLVPPMDFEESALLPSAWRFGKQWFNIVTSW